MKKENHCASAIKSKPLEKYVAALDSEYPLRYFIITSFK